MRSPLFILVTAFVVSLLVAQQFGGLHRIKATNAVDVTQEYLLRRPALGPALAAADQNDHALLLAWLNSAPSSDRLKLIGVLLAIASHDDGLAFDSGVAPTDATLYQYRRRFTAFTNIPSGNVDTDAMLDNLIAYIGVAGTRHPTPEDRALALKLLPRLERQLSLEADHGVYDTVGCIYFVQGNFSKSKVAFGEAVKLATHNSTSGSSEQQAATQRGLRLYRKRLEAATAADLQAIEQRTPPPPPILLPLASDSAGSEQASEIADPLPAIAPAGVPSAVNVEKL